jgi:DNA polymerase III delta prime subunit
MTISNLLNPLNSTKLIALDKFLDEMVGLYNANKFPKVLLLNGKKGIGKFTLVIHFLNYIFTKQEKEPYNINNKEIITDSAFYNQLIEGTNQDVLLIKTEENMNIKIDDVRNLKSILSRSSLSSNPRFIIFDEVEFINENSGNALLKSIEEPSSNNFFILINNQQADLIQTISSRCLINNIFLNSSENNTIIKYLLENNKIENLLDLNCDLSPGLYIRFNEIFLKLKIDKNDNILTKINKLLNEYKKSKNKILINLTLFLIDQYFIKSAKNDKKRLDFLLTVKSDITKNINDFIKYNLNINSVLSSIEIKLNNV